MDYEIYNGEFDDVDPYQLGVDSYRPDVPCDEVYTYCPTEKFSNGNDESKAKFLNNFWEQFDKGWFSVQKKARKEKIKQRLTEFRAALPSVGDEVYVEYDTTKGTYYLCKVVFIPDHKKCVVVQYLNSSERLAIVGEFELFATFYTKAEYERRRE